MFTRQPIEQTEPPRSPKETLPTMYDLKSEDPEEPGLPDEYHYLQPQLLSATLRLANYPADQAFNVGDMNLYYDSRHLNWYKRPDWFLVLGVPRLYEQRDTRLSYVVWQEGVSPFLVVELLSSGTEKEDLGETESAEGNSPTKWQVYEQILRVPYYVVFDRYNNQLRTFKINGGSYQELEILDQKIWIPELNLGLGSLAGEYKLVTRQWLRWYDEQGNWIPTENETAQQERQLAQQERQLAQQERQRAEQERQRAEQERQRAEQAEALLAQERQQREQILERLHAMGIDPNELID